MKTLPKEVLHEISLDFINAVASIEDDIVDNPDTETLEKIFMETLSITLDRNSSKFPNNEVSPEMEAVLDYTVGLYMQMIHKDN